MLNSRFENDSAELIVVYGRRRLGKSALVREAVRERADAVYWQATEETAAAQLANFVDTASETFPLLEDIQRDWEAMLRALGREDAIVVLDEFPYLVESDNALGSHLSKLRRLRLVERDIPVTADHNSTRKSRYRLKEPLFRFWFRYVYGQQGELVQLGDDAYEEMTEGDFADLERTASEVQWSPSNQRERTEQYCCFCRSGFPMTCNRWLRSGKTCHCSHPATSCQVTVSDYEVSASRRARLCRTSNRNAHSVARRRVSTK